MLYLAFSAALSGTYQSAVIARDMVMGQYPEAVITIVDTKAATIGEGYLVMKAVEARAEGKTLAETKAIVEDLVRAYGPTSWSMTLTTWCVVVAYRKQQALLVA